MILLNKIIGQAELTEAVGSKCFHKESTIILKDLRYDYHHCTKVLRLNS